MMIAKTTAVRRLIAQVNQTVFEGELPVDLIDLDIDFQDDVWGYCVPSDEVDGRILLGLTDEFEDRRQFANTVVHELIHAMQIYNEATVGHDTRMWDHYVAAAERAGYQIDITY